MRIEFDPTNPTEAAAVRAMLTALGPAEVHLTGAPPMDGGVLSAKLDDVKIATLRVASDPWHEGTTVTREAIPTGVSDDGWQTVDPGPLTDSTGALWDERIHSTPATTNKDGTWRAKRGVTADQIAAVKAEREQAEADENSGPIEIKPEDFKAHVEEMTNGAATVDSSGEVVRTAPPAPPAPSGQSEAPLAPAASAESTATEAPSPPATVTASTSGSATSASPSSPSFLDVMKAITAAQKDGKIDTAKVKELCAAVGAGESTMGLNGPDNGDKRHVFLIVLNLDAEPRDAIIAEAMKEKEPSARLDLIKAMVS